MPEHARWLHLSLARRDYRRPNVLPLTRPRAFRFLQRDATRRAETRRRRRRASERHAVGCCGRVGRLSPLEAPKLQTNAPLTDNHETRCWAVKCRGDCCVDLLMALTPCQTL